MRTPLRATSGQERPIVNKRAPNGTGSFGWSTRPSLSSRSRCDPRESYSDVIIRLLAADGREGHAPEWGESIQLLSERLS
jgi:hypothetical protein